MAVGISRAKCLMTLFALASIAVLQVYARSTHETYGMERKLSPSDLSLEELDGLLQVCLLSQLPPLSAASRCRQRNPNR